MEGLWEGPRSPGQLAAPVNSHLLITREGLQSLVCLYLPSQGQPLPLPPMTALAFSLPTPLPEVTSTPWPELYACWLALPPALKIGQLLALQFKGSLLSLTSWAKANS